MERITDPKTFFEGKEGHEVHVKRDEQEKYRTAIFAGIYTNRITCTDFYIFVMCNNLQTDFRGVLVPLKDISIKAKNGTTYKKNLEINVEDETILVDYSSGFKISRKNGLSPFEFDQETYNKIEHFYKRVAPQKELEKRKKQHRLHSILHDGIDV